MNQREQSLRQVFEISDDSIVKLCSLRERSSGQGTRCSAFFKEISSDSKVIAHYRVWDQKSSNSPYRQVRGFEKFSVSGELLGREMRFDQAEKKTAGYDAKDQNDGYNGLLH